MSETLGIIAGVLAIVGVVLNNRKLISCFYLWMISNAIAAGLHLDAGMISLFVRDVVFFFLAIEGMLRWRKK